MFNLEQGVLLLAGQESRGLLLFLTSGLAGFICLCSNTAKFTILIMFFSFNCINISGQGAEVDAADYNSLQEMLNLLLK